MITGTLDSAAMIGHVHEFGDRFWWQVRLHNPMSEHRGIRSLITSAPKFETEGQALDDMVSRIKYLGGVVNDGHERVVKAKEPVQREMKW